MQKGLLFSLLLLLTVAGNHLTGRVVPNRDIQTQLNAYLEARHRENDFRGVVLVVRNDSILFSKGYGLANDKLSLPNTPQTVFRLASLTKQFTAAAILQLQERGKLKVQDRLCQYLENCPAAWKEITIHQLLTHSAGLFNHTKLPDLAIVSQKPHTVEQLIAEFRDKDLDFAPGTKFSYSNSGYLLLGHIIEKVSGKPYEAYVQENIFRPLKMKNSGYEKEGDGVRNRAQGYVKGPSGFEEARYLHMSFPFSAGGLYSTAEDLQRWNKALYSGKLLSPQSVVTMTTPYLESYGYGLRIDQYDGKKRISHNGRINGFTNHMAFYPQNQLCIIVLGNQERLDVEGIHDKLTSICLGKPESPSK